MTERIKSLLATYAVPIILALMALGAAQLELRQKESERDHAIDIQRVEAKARDDVQILKARDEELYTLQLDILCAVKPKDRRC